VPVVAAGVHLPLGIRGEWETGLLQDRQGVHVRPEPDRGAVPPALERRHYAVLGDAGLHLEGKVRYRVEDLSGGLFGVEAELGLAMDGAPEGCDLLAKTVADPPDQPVQPLRYLHDASSQLPDGHSARRTFYRVMRPVPRNRRQVAPCRRRVVSPGKHREDANMGPNGASGKLAAERELCRFLVKRYTLS